MSSRKIFRLASFWLLAIAVLALAKTSFAQSYDLTMDVLVNSSNATGYNTSATSPGEYQRYLERYLEHWQIPYRVIDTATDAPPSNLGSVQLIVAGHTGLSLSVDWQNAILTAVQGGTGFVNFDADPAIGSDLHIQGIFGTTDSYLGATATQITIPSAVIAGGSSPHYIAAMQRRFQDTPAGDLVYKFHKDANNNQQVAAPTILRGAQGTVIANLGNSPLILATQTPGGRAVDFTTYDFMHPDRFGFMMGIDDLVWRSIVWAARKPFILRGYPRFWASQMDDQVAGWGLRLRSFWDTTLTGPVNSDGTGGPWKVNANAQFVNLVRGTTDRTNGIADVNSGFLKISFHTNTGAAEGDLYWNPQSSSPLTDAEWQTNLATAQLVMTGNGGSDTLPALSKAMAPHYWNLSNNVGYDMWNTLGTRYINEIQMPGTYYNYGPPKTDDMRIKLRPFRIYELPPTGINPDELYPIYYADFMTVGSTAGLPSQKFFSFATQLLGNQFPSADAVWPNSADSITVQKSINNFTEYTWRFFSGMAPVEVYNHDGGSFAASTTTEAQQAITGISSFLNANGAIHVFVEDEGAYLTARTQSVLTSATETPSNISLTFTGNATDMDSNLVPTKFYLFNGDDEGTQVQVPGFTGGYTYTMANTTPAAIGVSNASLSFSILPGGSPASQSITVGNTGSGTLSYTATSDSAWLTAAAGTGTAPDTLTITADPTGLASGVYKGTIQLIAAGAANSPKAIAVTLTVKGPMLAVDDTSLTFVGLCNNATVAAQNITLKNIGVGTLNWSASTNAAWLQPGSSSGTIAAGDSYVLPINVNVAGLPCGASTGAITISSPEAITGSPQTINASLTLAGVLMQEKFTSSTLAGWAVSPLGAGWTVSNNIVRYNGAGVSQMYAGNSNWSNYTMQADMLLSAGIVNYPGGIRAYINPTTGASYAAWVYPATGVIKLWRTTTWDINTAVLLGTSTHLTMDSTNWHTLALSVNSGRVTVSYDGNTIISATDATLSGGMVALDGSNKPVQFKNILVTGDQVETTNLTSLQTSYNFTVTAGKTSDSQSLQVAADDSSIAAWSATPSSAWLTVVPSNGQTPGSAVVQVNASALSSGTYNAQVNLNSYGTANKLISLPVTVTVVQPSTNQLTVAPAALLFFASTGGSAPAAQTLSLTSSTAGLSYTVTSDSSWLVSPPAGTTPGSATVNVNPTGLAAGAYTGHLIISAPGAANPSTTIAVTLTITQVPQVVLMQTTFPNPTLDGWAYSPLGLAPGWSVSNSTVSYDGRGATQLYAGNNKWANYLVHAGFHLSSLVDNPGGIRAYIDPATGASYAAWLYPAEGLVKVWRTTTWDIGSNPVLLGVSSHLAMDTTTWHSLSLSVNGGQIVASYDGGPVVTVTDSTLTGGMMALDVSNQPIQFNNVFVLGSQGINTLLSSPQSGYTFTVTAGKTSSTQSLQIATSDGSVAAWSAIPSLPWLTVAAPTGKTPGSTTIQVDATALASGTYSNLVNVSSFGATNNSISIPVALTVTAPPVAATTTTLTASPASIVAGGTVTLKATVTSSGGTPVGQVTFLSGTTTLGTATLDSSGAATFTTTALPVGSNQLTASFAATSSFAASVSSAVTVIVTSTSAPDFSIAANPTSLSISRGKSGTATFTVTPLNGFNQAITFSCSGLPSEATCTFSPSSITPDGTSTVSSTLTLKTTAPTTATLHQGPRPFGIGRGLSGVAALALLIFVLPLKRINRTSKYFVMVLLAAVVCLGSTLGCGGGGSSGSPSNPGTTTPSDPGTPTGTTQVSITASAGSGSGSAQHVASLTVTITN